MQQQSPANMGVGKNLLLGIQHLFAMFGSQYWFPSPNRVGSQRRAVYRGAWHADFFTYAPRERYPLVFVGSSFAFIGVIQITALYVRRRGRWGGQLHLPFSLSGGLPLCNGRHHRGWCPVPGAGAVGQAVWCRACHELFPPVVTGPMIYIGRLTLAPTALIISWPAPPLYPML